AWGFSGAIWRRILGGGLLSPGWMGGYFRACNGSAGVAKRSSGGGLLDCAGDWGCAGCAELDARLSAGTDERVGGHMLRAVRVDCGRARGRRRDQASGMVGLGRE